MVVQLHSQVRSKETIRRLQFLIKMFDTFKNKEIKNHYAMIGMAFVTDEYPLYYDATNEKGLSMAGLNFPGNAEYKPYCALKDNVAPFELIPWVLGQCATVREARELLGRTNLLRHAFSPELPLTPLHWLLADREECVVLEGWVPAEREGKIAAALDKLPCAFGMEEPPEGEEPPVLLKNNGFSSNFEWVVGMYSYPKYGTFDPTTVMSIFYFLIFGLMFADVGYGILVTLIGFKLAAQAADADHPFGHGRMEYISGFLVSVAILLMGFELLKSSVQALFTPAQTTFSPLIAALLLLAIGVKVFLWQFNRKLGKTIDLQIGSETCHRHRTIGIDICLYNYVGQRNDRMLQSGRKSCHKDHLYHRRSQA